MAEKVVDDGWRIPDELWAQIEPLLPSKAPHTKGGRPWTADRGAMDGIFYVLRTGCQWKALPRGLGAASTVHDRFQQWVKGGVFRRLWQEGLLEFDSRVRLDWEWQAMDGAMTKAPLGGGKNRRQSYGSGQEGSKAFAADRGSWRAHWPCSRRRQPTRHEADRSDHSVDTGGAPDALAGTSAAYVHG